MTNPRVVLLRLRAALGLRVPGDDLEAELRSHIDLACDEMVRSGVPEREARRRAHLQLGGVSRTQQAQSQVKTLAWLEALLHDFRFACRQLRKNPGFTWTASCVLGLSLAASLVVFSFVDAALVRPLPYRSPARLIALFERLPAGDRFHLSYADVQDWSRQNRTLADLGAYRPDRFVLMTLSGPEAVNGAVVSSGFFSTLGVQPRLGAGFERSDDEPGGERKVLLSYATWVQRYGSDRNVLGRSVRLDRQAYRITGVLPRGFHFAAMPDPAFWRTMNGYCADNNACYPYYGVGRLREGVPLEVARQDLLAIAGHIASERPASNRDRSAEVVPLHTLLFGKVRPILLALLAGALLLTFIGLVNVFALIMTRAERRRHETATRSALGATRLRLLRQFVVEGLLLAGLGACIGMAASFGALAVLTRKLSTTTLERMPYLAGLHLSWHVLWLACVVMLVAALAFSAAPLLTLNKSQLSRGLADGGRSASSRSWRRAGAGLSVAQLSLTVVLLISAGLLLQSTRNFLHQDLGLTPEHLSMLHVQAQSDLTDAKAVLLAQQSLARVQELPGVQAAGIAQSPPLNASEAFRMRFTHYKIAGKADAGLGNEAASQVVSAGYFETLQVRLLRGRFFSPLDGAKQQHVAIVNDAMVRENFASGENPIGRLLVSHYDPGHPLQIVGVVQSAKEGSLDAPAAAAVYQPFAQAPDGEFYVLLRSSSQDEAVLQSAATALRRMNANLLVDGERTLQQEIQTSEATELHQSSATLATVSAALALLLATAGLYGVVAYSAGQRTREIGIRMALGAQRSAIYQLILGEAAFSVAIGLLLGTLASFATSRLLHGLVFQVAPWDPRVLAAVAVTLALAALAASLLPAHRAAFTEPTESLRAI